MEERKCRQARRALIVVRQRHARRMVQMRRHLCPETTSTGASIAMWSWSRAGAVARASVATAASPSTPTTAAVTAATTVRPVSPVFNDFHADSESAGPGGDHILDEIHRNSFMHADATWLTIPADAMIYGFSDETCRVASFVPAPPLSSSSSSSLPLLRGDDYCYFHCNYSLYMYPSTLPPPS